MLVPDMYSIQDNMEDIIPEQMDKAVNEVLNHEMSVRATAEMYGIPKEYIR